jgi:hypothetical protein
MKSLKIRQPFFVAGQFDGVKHIAFLNESLGSYDETEGSSKPRVKICGCPFTSNNQPSLNGDTEEQRGHST